jgi:hypothetical protein
VFDYSGTDSDVDSVFETDLADPKENAAQPVHASDVTLLFADNEHPPEYYIQQLNAFNEAIYKREDYDKGNTALLDRVGENGTSECYLYSCLDAPFSS